MYICTECGQQYKSNPQYCECGNDVFHEIAETTINTKINEKLKQMGISPYAILFFIVCMVLSLIILICIKPQNNEIKTQPNINQIQQKSNIPNIDTIWVENSNKKETQPKVYKEKTKPKSTAIVQKTVTTKTQTSTKTTPKQTTKTQVKMSTTNSTKTNTATKANTASSVPKAKTNTAQNSTVTKQTESVTKTKKTTTETAKKNNQELYNYKIQLRQALFSKLSVASIQGNGNCGIEFSIDSTGKLINRNFTYQSENKSVNDEVYKMLMRLPKYYPPPTAYKGEKIKMTFSFSNGNYSINYTN